MRFSRGMCASTRFWFSAPEYNPNPPHMVPSQCLIKQVSQLELRGARSPIVLNSWPLTSHRYGSTFSWWRHAHPALTPALCPALQWKWSHSLSRHGVLYAIRWVKHTGPLLECRDGACLGRNKSPLAVARVALRHYSAKRGMVLILTNTREQGSFTTHPLSIVPILQWLLGHLSPSQGYICIQLPEVLILCNSHILLTQKVTTHTHARRVPPARLSIYYWNKMTVVALKALSFRSCNIDQTGKTLYISFQAFLKAH